MRRQPAAWSSTQRPPARPPAARRTPARVRSTHLAPPQLQRLPLEAGFPLACLQQLLQPGGLRRPLAARPHRAARARGGRQAQPQAPEPNSVPQTERLGSPGKASRQAQQRPEREALRLRQTRALAVRHRSAPPGARQGRARVRPAARRRRRRAHAGGQGRRLVSTGGRLRRETRRSGGQRLWRAR